MPVPILHASKLGALQESARVKPQVWSTAAKGVLGGRQWTRQLLWNQQLHSRSRQCLCMSNVTKESCFSNNCRDQRKRDKGTEVCTDKHLGSVDASVQFWGFLSYLWVAELLVNDDALHEPSVLHGASHLAFNLVYTSCMTPVVWCTQ